LTVIKGYAQLLQIKPAVREDAHLQSVVKGILAGTERLHKIVHSMLDVAKIDSQVLSVVKRDMHLMEIFERLAARFESDLEARELTLKIEGIEELPLISADPGLLYKVFEQIIGNALKYTPDGGHIEVVGHIVRTNGGPAVTEVIVRDSGIGIDPAHHELIFEKFYQTGEVSLHSSGETTFKAGGPGLGLAIAKGIIQAHGGRIWVESPGCDEAACPGSSFYVEIPVE
jgi:signal transduction histidine kinase